MPDVDFKPSQVRNIIKLFVVQRRSTPKIGKIYGVSHNVILSVLRSNGVTVSLSDRRTKFFTAKQRADIVKLYTGGLGSSTATIGSKYGCSYATIRRVLQEENAFNTDSNAKKRITFSEMQTKVILEKYGDGASAKSLSIEFGCCQSVMLRLIRSRGLNTKDYGRGKNPQISDRGYVRTGRRLSRKVYRMYRQHINPEGLSSREHNMHLDHILSIADGYALGLTIFDLAHPCNLRMLPALDNLRKYKKSDHTKQDLLNKIRAWNKKYGDPYVKINIAVKYVYRYGRYRLSE
jgi:hypothetical protein